MPIFTSMKIAVAAQGGLVDENFGHCTEFMVFSTSLFGGLSQEPSVMTGDGRGFQPKVASELAAAGVTRLVVGSIGEDALRELGSRGIQVFRGASGDARGAAEACARGRL
jgi:predicted Fe-Mo cluster-binding NifX family protein